MVTTPSKAADALLPGATWMYGRVRYLGLDSNLRVEW